MNASSDLPSGLRGVHMVCRGTVSRVQIVYFVFPHLPLHEISLNQVLPHLSAALFHSISSHFVHLQQSKSEVL